MKKITLHFSRHSIKRRHRRRKKISPPTILTPITHPLPQKPVPAIPNGIEGDPKIAARLFGRSHGPNNSQPDRRTLEQEHKEEWFKYNYGDL